MIYILFIKDLQSGLECQTAEKVSGQMQAGGC
jgi:hypothetical protein